MEYEASKLPRNEAPEAPRGWDLGRGVPCPVGVEFDGAVPLPRNFCKINIEVINFAAFCEDCDSLSFTIALDK